MEKKDIPTENNSENEKLPTDEIQTVSSSLKPPKKRIPVALIVGIVVVLLALLLAGLKLTEAENLNDNSVTERTSVQNDGNRTVTKEEEDIASVVSKVSPSVVSVLVTLQGGDNPFSVREQSGAGTGMIISKDGYVLTNKHVVKGADSVNVLKSDGTTYKNVKVVGTDPLNDVAVLKIPNVNDLPVIELGNSSSVRVGQKVIAIGNSLGQYQNTVTSGIISGTGRPIQAQAGDSVESLTDLLQTDAAINPGNSGGPLLNLQGQVVGINTAIIEDAQGIGFAIPINATKGILKGVLADGTFERAYLGIQYTAVTPDVAEFYNLPVKQGAYVFSGEGSAIIENSPADKAGVEDKDIITKINNVEIGKQGGLSSLIGEYAPGDTVELTLLRDDKTITRRVTLEAFRG